MKNSCCCYCSGHIAASGTAAGDGVKMTFVGHEIVIDLWVP